MTMPTYMAWLRQHLGHQTVISTGAGAVIYDERGRVLLQKRRDIGLWGIPGGGQEFPAISLPLHVRAQLGC